MRASGRPPHSHRDPARPGRGGDRLGLSIGALAHRLMSLRASLSRRLSGPLPRPGYKAASHAAQPAPPSWLTAPRAMLGRDGEPTPAAEDWPDHVFDDRAVPAIRPTTAYELPMDAASHDDEAGESRIDADASGPGVLIRTPRRSSATAPVFAPAMDDRQRPVGPQPAEAAPAVRYTRTPDPVLHERRQRARDAEREAEVRARALLDAQAASAEAEARVAEERAAQAAASPPEPPLPLWRQPFVAPPGVRFFRTPDRRPEPSRARSGTGGPAPAEAPLPDPLSDGREWSDVPNWPDIHGWFGGGDWSSIEAWSAVQAEPRALGGDADLAAGRFVSVPLDVSHLRLLPPGPVYALDRLVRFDGMPRPADGQDNALAGVAEAEPDRENDGVAPEAPPRPALTLVFGPGTPVAPPAPRPATISAMAARAAIRAARVREPAGYAPVSAAPVQIEAHRVPPAEPAPVPSPASPRAATTIPSRPILLRTPKAALAPELEPAAEPASESEDLPLEAAVEASPVLALPPPSATLRAVLPEPRSTLIPAGRHVPMSVVENADYEPPSLELLAEPDESGTEEVDADELEQNALNLQQTVQDFGVRGDILAVRPGPVVTLYELEPAPGTKSSRVIGLSDDIARSMSAVSARVAVVPGRNVIGIELPNAVRETVYLRELLSSPDFCESRHKLALCLGKNIGGEPIIADLARMPHLLVAGTTGSGKSVAINTMILSLLYRMKPEECRLIMVDPKMLELSVYDGIPHLLSPVVTDPKKAVIALKWAVREMEERYKKMSKVSVRNIDGYNARMAEARARGEIITRTMQTGFNRETGEAVFAEEEMELSALPYIVVVVDEMADLMMVAGKDIEGAIQRLAQMARAAGIHLIMATQRPSVDVITGTIKANFPTRISFQVTSKIDSRTILGEMGAEQLLGQGDMLFMAGGGRTTRVHGPFCSDAEVESVVAHLKRQGRPAYLDAVTADDGSAEPEKGAKGGKGRADRDEAEADEADAPVFDIGSFAAAASGGDGDLYEQAITVVLRDKKASTSYIQRRLQIGYNRAASIMERMEIEGIVGPANHAGKREILVDGVPTPSYDDD